MCAAVLSQMVFFVESQPGCSMVGIHKWNSKVTTSPLPLPEEKLSFLSVPFSVCLSLSLLCVCVCVC